MLKDDVALAIKNDTLLNTLFSGNIFSKMPQTEKNGLYLVISQISHVVEDFREIYRFQFSFLSGKETTTEEEIEDAKTKIHNFLCPDTCYGKQDYGSTMVQTTRIGKNRVSTFLTQDGNKRRMQGVQDYFISISK